jgi:NADH dehydrogenase
MPPIISGTLQAQHVLIPLREVLPGVKLYIGEMEAIDLDRRSVTLAGDREGQQLVVEGNVLVLALGSVTDLSRFPGLQEHGLQTKTIADFIHLRNHLIAALDAASIEPDVDERRRLLTFVVAGAGFAGIEIASETNELIRGALRAYSSLDPSEIHVISVDILTRILPTFNDRLAARALGRLQSRGIDVKLGVGLKEATATGVLLGNGERIATATVIATAGIGTNPLLKALPLELDRGRVRCDDRCRVVGRPGVYAIGDDAAVPGPGGTALPAMVRVAFSEAEQAAHNILAELRGQPTHPSRYRSMGEVAMLSRSYGLAQIRGLSLAGWPASLVSRWLFLSFMPTWRRRLALLLHWQFSRLFPHDLTPLPLGRSNLVVPMRFGAGDVIVREGEIARRFYIIREGEVEVVQQADGSDRRIRRLGPGESFGELALLQRGARTATVKALTDLSVLSIAREDFGVLAAEVPALRQAWDRATPASSPPTATESEAGR